MKKICLIVLCGFICALVTSCTFMERYDPGFIQRDINNTNIKKVKVDMTKQQVLDIMGVPLVHEMYERPNVWFYYTSWDWADCAITKSECTPIVFKNGRIAGIGVVYYRNYLHKDWLFYNKALFRESF